MSHLQEATGAVFAASGPLARVDAGFRPRPGQTSLAMAVASTIEQGGQLVAEAATGVGKTYAYLVPALLSGERVLLSTATKALQDQLYARDLPHLIQTLGLPVRTALLKGRASYLCLHRMEHATHQAEPAMRSLLARTRQWAATTRTGDLAELPGLDERSPIIPLITSTRENCLGADCPRFRDCHVQLARRQALAADVVVINHHLFFADMSIRESGMAELLPTARVVVFDEAHQLNETGIQFLGQQLATSQLIDLARDMQAAGLAHARGLQDWPSLAGALDLAARDLRLLAGPTRASRRLRWVTLAPQDLPEELWQAGLADVAQALASALAALQTVEALAPDLARLHQRAAQLHELTQRFMKPCAPDLVRWVDVSHALRLFESPLDIAQAVRTRLLVSPSAGDLAPEKTEADPPGNEQPAPAEAPGQSAAAPAATPGQPTHGPAAPAAAHMAPSGSHGQGHHNAKPTRAWIFVSATLGDDERLSWFTEPCGLQQACVMRIGSPFDYAAQAALYVPEHIARPSDPSHSAQVARLAGDAAWRLGGRTLVLTTTLRALQSIGEALIQRFGPPDSPIRPDATSLAGHPGGRPIQVLLQGSLPKRVLMDRFRTAGQATGADKPDASGCILVASASFWEGLDVPGRALQCVVIDKLPFPPPGDPLVEARCRRLEQVGRSPFAHYSIPEAAVALKQGAGRLIRHENDSGVLIICDNRLTHMGYGRRLLAALPPMRRLQTPAELQDMLAVLEKL